MTSLLIVDDDARMRTLIRSIVADLVDSVSECSDGADAQAMYAEQHPDWVFMDVAMPLVNGLTATFKIKGYDPKARIIIVTGQESPTLRAQAESAGAFGFVMKDDLLELRGILGQSERPIQTAEAFGLLTEKDQ